MLKLSALRDSITVNKPESDNVVNIRGIQKNNLPYIFIWVIYYGWVVSFTTWWTASPLTENVFSTELRSLLHSVNLVSSGVFIFIIRKEWFARTARIGAVLVLAGMILFAAAPVSAVQQLSAIVIGIALGCINISILIPFVFTLNNTEKLYGIVISNALICLISLLQESDRGNYLQGNMDLLLSSVILITALSAALLFNKTGVPLESEDKAVKNMEFHPRVYLTLFFNAAFIILGKGAGKGVLNLTAAGSEYPVIMCYFIGGLAGCLVSLAIHAFFRKALIGIGNITFFCIAMGLLCNSFAVRSPGLAVVFAVLLGMGSTIGMISMYYIIGVVAKKYNSMQYLKLSIIIIGICGGVSGIVVGNLINNINNSEISMIATIISAAVMLLFIMLSPVVSQPQYYDDWAKDSERMEIDNEQLYMFKKYRLSKREIEVCKLLLQGYTMRQISGILSIAYPTVNTYCTSAYRKLGINSRTELLLLFKDYSIK